MVNEKSFSMVGVPDSSPAVDSVKPLGREPVVTANVYGDVPPLPVSVSLYVVPMVPPGSVVGLTVIAAGQTRTVYARAPVHTPVLSVAVTVKLKLPSALGVPDRAPAVESVRPVGSDPEVTANVYG